MLKGEGYVKRGVKGVKGAQRRLKVDDSFSFNLTTGEREKNRLKTDATKRVPPEDQEKSQDLRNEGTTSGLATRFAWLAIPRGGG